MWTVLWKLAIWWTILSRCTEYIVIIRWQYCEFLAIWWTILSIYCDNIRAENTKASYVWHVVFKGIIRSCLRYPLMMSGKIPTCTCYQRNKYSRIFIIDNNETITFQIYHSYNDLIINSKSILLQLAFAIIVWKPRRRQSKKQRRNTLHLKTKKWNNISQTKINFSISNRYFRSIK